MDVHASIKSLFQLFNSLHRCTNPSLRCTTEPHRRTTAPHHCGIYTLEGRLTFQTFIPSTPFPTPPPYSYIAISTLQIPNTMRISTPISDKDRLKYNVQLHAAHLDHSQLSGAISQSPITRLACHSIAVCMLT